MKIKMMNIFVAFFAVVALSTPVVASEAKSLVELLDMIESAKISETAEYRQREADFLMTSASNLSFLKVLIPKLLKSVVQTVLSKLFATTTLS